MSVSDGTTASSRTDVSSQDPSPQAPTPLPPRFRRAAPFVVAGLMLQMAVSMLLGASKDSPTYDEPTHLAAGILNVREHDLRWNAEHPPLVKVLAGLATLGSDIRIPTNVPAFRDGNEFQMARVLLYQSGNDAEHLIWLARLPMIGLTLLFALVVFGFARDLFGITGGLIALAVYTLCPTVLAHGRMIHTDIACAGFLLATAWFLWRVESRGLAWFAAACGAFGLALASKFTALFAIPPLAVMAFWTGFGVVRGTTARRVLRGSARVAILLVAGFGILWLVYVAVSPALDFNTHFYDHWKVHGVAGATIDHLPVPSAYRVGLRFAVSYDQVGRRTGFLFGHTYEGGSILFYPVILIMKTPLGTIALWILGFVAILFSRRRPAVLRSLVPIPFTILALSMASSTNIGIRHVAVVPIFGAVAAGGVALRAGSRRRLIVIAVLLAATAASVWGAFPSHLSYTNEAFGGNSNAYRYTADSNVDWGQDLKRLGTYLTEHPAQQLDWIAYFGTADPSAYGIHAKDATLSSRAEIHGLMAVSVSLLNLVPEKWAWIQEGRDPVARVGDSILLYRVP